MRVDVSTFPTPLLLKCVSVYVDRNITKTVFLCDDDFHVLVKEDQCNKKYLKV